MSTVMYAFRARSDDHLAEQVAAVRDINKKRIFGDGGEELQVFRTSSALYGASLRPGTGLRTGYGRIATRFQLATTTTEEMYQTRTKRTRKSQMKSIS